MGSEMCIRDRPYLNDKPTDVLRETAQKGLQDKCIQRMRASKLFSQVEPGAGFSSDVNVKIRIENDGKANLGLAFLTGLTLYIIPSCAEDNFKLVADVENQKTGKKTSIQLEESITTWQEILLIFVLPFKSPFSASANVQERLFDNLIVKMHEAGCLDMTVQSVPSP